MDISREEALKKAEKMLEQGENEKDILKETKLRQKDLNDIRHKLSKAF